MNKKTYVGKGREGEAEHLKGTKEQNEEGLLRNGMRTWNKRWEKNGGKDRYTKDEDMETEE